MQGKIREFIVEYDEAFEPAFAELQKRAARSGNTEAFLRQEPELRARIGGKDTTFVVRQINSHRFQVKKKF